MHTALSFVDEKWLLLYRNVNQIGTKSKKEAVKFRKVFTKFDRLSDEKIISLQFPLSKWHLGLVQVEILFLLVRHDNYQYRSV
ncbi:hypothetical protein D1109_00205 [Actinobacillus pleuropneumoniae]|nr:hypothetical protein D1109_00205 [Actinobacillus pleuropneumoniae]UKH36626.1 hypothetical protein D1101_03140 [Actinobacillus pleuropneumoniae serovar 8 str. 405]